MEQTTTLPALKRHRNTTATRARMANMHRIVEALRQGRLAAFDIMDLLNMSPSGVRKYLNELRQFDLLKSTECSAKGGMEYWIEGTDERIQELFDAICPDQPEGKQRPKASPALPKYMPRRDSDRRVRCVSAVQLGMQRDPLVAALFGGVANHV